jgi:hypothetical protein
MFIVLSINNGEGYSDPYVKVFEKFEEALERYLWCISDLLNPNYPYEMGSDYVNGEAIPGVYKTMFTSFDEDEEVDNFGVHMFPVESGDCVEIICDYADEVSVYKEECSEVFDEPFYQADGVEDEETGQMTIKIYIK